MNDRTRRLMATVLVAAVPLGFLIGCGGSPEKADQETHVYYLNPKGEVQHEWDEITEAYKKETGNTVKVTTATNYDDSLKSEMAKKNPPTIFQTNLMRFDPWKNSMADLQETDLYKQLRDKNLALKSDDGAHTVAIPYVMESYGIIYNKELFGKYLKLPKAKVKSINDIKSFQSLKAVADDIQDRKEELGVKGAFTSTGFEQTSAWRFNTHLANIPLYYEFKDEGVTRQPATIQGKYLPQFKQILDLYMKDSTVDRSTLSGKTGDDANSEFALGEAVFYQNGTWAWADLEKAGMEAKNVGMIPIYIGAPGEENQGLSTGTEQYWCINKNVPKKDQKASEDFLDWVITSKTGKDIMSKKMGFTTPFASFSGYKSDNPIMEAAQADAKKQTVPVTWAFTMDPSQQYKDTLGDALLEYAQGTGDWDKVKSSFVDGWAKEYQAAHRQ